MIQSEPYKLICLKHDQIAVSLNLGKDIAGNSRLLCYQCLIDQLVLKGNLKEQQCLLVQINEFIKDPLNQLLQVMKRDGIRQFIEIDYLFNLLKEIKQLEVKFKQMIAELTKCVNEMKKEREMYFNDFQKLLKLNSIIKQYEKATSLGKGLMSDHQREKEISRFLKQIDYLSEILEDAKQNPDYEEIKIQENLQKDFQTNLTNFIKDIQRFEKDSNNNLKFHNQVGLNESIYEELQEFPEIHFQISEGKTIIYELLHSGSPEGIDQQEFNSPYKSQYNQLSIIRTTNGSKFGAFIPSIGIYSARNSFAFQYNQKEIFKLDIHKVQANCLQKYLEHIFWINGTKILLNYKTSQFYELAENPNSNTKIFGEQNPEIKDIKIYKVKF